MKRFFKMFRGIFIVILLSGCFGESYDFSPPKAVIMIDYENGGQYVELAEANIDWKSDKTYTKETEDIVSLARNQNKMYVKPGQELQFSLSEGIFDEKRVEISLLQGEKEIELPINIGGNFFNVPEEKGEYILELYLPSDKGYAQYVGYIVIQ